MRQIWRKFTKNIWNTQILTTFSLEKRDEWCKKSLEKCNGKLIILCITAKTQIYLHMSETFGRHSFIY